MKKSFSLIRHVLIPMMLIIYGVSNNTILGEAASRYKTLRDKRPDYLYDISDDGKLYLPINETTYYKSSGGYIDASYRLESSDLSVLETIGGGLKGKKRGTAILTCRKYQDGKYSVLYQTQVVVGEPRFYTREYNMTLGHSLPQLDSRREFLGFNSHDSKYSYTYQPHDTSIIAKRGKTDEYFDAVNFGSTKVDIIEIYNGKKRVCDTFTVNVKRPELRWASKNITLKKDHANLLWKNIFIYYEGDFEIIYESDDPSIVRKNKGEKFIVENCGTTNLHMYCMIDGEKYHIGTSKVTIVP